MTNVRGILPELLRKPVPSWIEVTDSGLLVEWENVIFVFHAGAGQGVGVTRRVRYLKKLSTDPMVLCPLTALHVTEAVIWPHIHLRQDMRRALEKESSPTQAKRISSGVTKRSSWGKPAVSRDGMEVVRRAWRLG